MALSSNNKTSSSVLCFNGKFFAVGTPLVTADNRGFRYGDGLFETIRVVNGQIKHADLHFERLLAGMRTLIFDPPFPSENELADQILDVCKRNSHIDSARVRLMVFRGDGGFHDPAGQTSQYIIQSELLSPDSITLNKEGWKLGVYPPGRKACDALAHLKSNNYLLYSMASRYAGAQGWDECLVLNIHDRIAEGSFTNLFYCEKGTIYTPPLSEGCVAGVMRRWLINAAATAGFSIKEKAITIEALENTDEVFLTNALRGIKWVKSFHHTTYTGETARLLHNMLFQEF